MSRAAKPGTVMHEHIKETCELAHTYAEDGAYQTAASILFDLALEVRKHADGVDSEMRMIALRAKGIKS